MLRPIRLDTMLGTWDFTGVTDAARRAEEFGFSGLWTAETAHAPFLPLALAASGTHQIQLGTAIAVAFARTPMATAMASWDLAGNSKGRFILGLGTQVKGHNERRFSVPWTPPGPRLRDYILCLRAIWDSWQHGTRPGFRSEHYQYTLTSPFFNPGPIERPFVNDLGQEIGVPVYIAGVNAYLCRLAGELCDGLHVHPFNSAKFLTDVTLPNMEKGAQKAGRTLDAIERMTAAFVVMGDTEEERQQQAHTIRQQIAFYASTRTYTEVLRVHGWESLAGQLNELSVQGRWQEMAELITDEMLETYAVIGRPEEIPEKIQKRYAGLLTRVAFYVPYEQSGDPERWRRFVRAFNGAPAQPTARTAAGA